MVVALTGDQKENPPWGHLLYFPDTARATFTLALNCSSIPAWNAWSDGNDVILVSYDIRCKWVSVSEDEHNSQTAKSPWEPG